MIHRSFFAAFLLISAAAAVAQEPPAKPRAPRPTFAIQRTVDKITVDGRLDEATWKSQTPAALPWETNPGDNIAAPVATDAFFAYDDSTLYVAFHARDPRPSEIRAHLSDRDRAYSDDFVGVVLDTFNDERRAFEFFVNPLGVQMDLQNDDVGGGEDDTWDAIWESAGRVVDDGYIVEMAIPFSSLRFRSANGPQTWGIDMVRVYPRSLRHRIGSSQLSRGVNCYLCQAGKLTGLDGITPGRNLELDPTLTTHRTDTRENFPDGSLEDGDFDVDPGLSARWGVTPNLTLNAAINPDFSQVEADAAQLDVNTQFTLFFNEKRPFFLEGADFFNTPLQLVYTRTVADPDWGAKLTGKEGKHAVGLFATGDSVTNFIIPGHEDSFSVSLDDENISSVLRYRQDVGKNSTVGVLVTDRSANDYRNSAGGLDGFFRLNEKDTITAQYLYSDTEYPDDIAQRFGQSLGSFGDDAYRLLYRHGSDKWFWRLVREDIGEDFRADSGFMPQVDYINNGAILERTWRPEKRGVTRIFWGGEVFEYERHDGNLIEDRAQSYVGISGPKQSFLYLRFAQGHQSYRDETFKKNEVGFFMEMRPSGSLYLSLDGNIGDRIDFANVRHGERVRLIPRVTWNVGDHLKLDLTHTFEELNVQQGRRLFTANVSDLRAVYQFNIRTFVRAIIQYTNVERNPSLYDFEIPEKTERLFPQLLFSYKLNPQTVFFVGYSENSFGNETTDLTVRDRTFFTKIGYAWLF